MSLPSVLRSVGGVPPATVTNVGSTSMFPATASHTAPAGTFPGHHATVGSRIPPSQVVNLNPRSGVLSPRFVPPLSDVNRTSVSPSSFSSRMVSRTRPTDQSSSSTQSPYTPFLDLPRNASPGWYGLWTAVCGRYRKNGRSAFFLMNATASSVYRTVSLSCPSGETVSMTFSSRRSGSGGRLGSPMSLEYGSPKY